MPSIGVCCTADAGQQERQLERLLRMDNRTSQTFADFERFLAGLSAPALIGHALATVVRQDIRVVAEAVLKHAYGSHNPDRLAAVLSARDKVFDIFFYRVVRFKRVYEFFPRFERALIAAAPPPDKEAIADLFRRHPWQNIRPISINDPQDLLLEVRGEATVSTGEFNEELYKNATHQILSADRRFTFKDKAMGENVAQYQAQVTEVFDDFVSLIKDALQRREIQLANEADKDVVYKHRPDFQIENYLGQLADLAIALFNDNFLEHSVQIFGIIRALTQTSGLDAENLKQVQGKVPLFNRQKLCEYSAVRTGPLLLRTILTIFPPWRPDPLLNQLRNEPDREERRIALTILEAYGREIYSVVADHLERCDPSTPWHYTRNLAYLLGRLATDQPQLKNRAVQYLAQHLRKDSAPQLAQEVIGALASIHTDRAIEALGDKLKQFAPEFGKAPDVTDLCHQILAALFKAQTEPALRVALDFALDHQVLDKYEDDFARVALPESLRIPLEARVRREARKLKMSFSLLGDPYVVKSMMLALGSAELADVGALCDEIGAAFSQSAELNGAIEKLRGRPVPPPPLAYDPTLHALLYQRNLPEAFSYAYESGLSGTIELMTRARVVCEVAFRKGDIWSASVPSLFSKDEDAFFWIFALDIGSISSIRFDPAKTQTPGRMLEVSTPELIREGLFRAKHVQQIVGGILSPESRFKRRQKDLPLTGFQGTGTLGPYKAIWSVLGEAVDLKTIQGATGFAEPEIYRVLFDFVRQNLLIIESGHVDQQLATIDDALTALGLFIRRIESHPTYFQSYQSAAEACEYLSKTATDETIRSSAWALHTYFLNAFNLRRVLSPQSIEFCARALGLMGAYIRTGADARRQELLDYLDIYLPEESRWPEPPQDEASFIQSILEQIENIDGMNDPFDAITETRQQPGQVIDSLDEAIMAQFDAPAEDIKESAARSPLDALGDAAGLYVKPLKDFVRQIERNFEADRETPVEWLLLVEPSLDLLVSASEKMSETRVRDTALRLKRAFAQQRQHGAEVLTPAFGRYVLKEYQQLEEVLPSTFKLELPAAEIANKKEQLFVKFVVRQVPEVTEEIVNRILLAGYRTFDDLAQTPPDEVSRLAGVERPLANKIFMKLYQYQDLYYHPNDAGSRARYLAVYLICLNALKDIHTQVEELTGRSAADGHQALKERLLHDRQRALWGIFALLCLRDRLDLIEKLQRMVFEERIRIIDEHFGTLSFAPLPAAGV